MKKCSKCKQYKDLSEFHKNKTTKSGHSPICKLCDTIYTREKRYKRIYGITKEQYYEMYENQQGNCCICGEHFDLLCVDHNHKTGKVRSLLCKRCNYNLGVYKENPIIFQRFIDYINIGTL